MATAIRMVSHEDRLSLVDHLEELRTRLIVSVAVLAVAFGICLWQNHELLHIMNKPLQTETKRQVANGEGTVGQANLAQQGLLKTAQDMQALVGLLAKPDSGLSRGVRAQLPPLSAALKADVSKLPRNAVGIDPVTTGIAEPFTTTITVTLYFALIISLPVILFELYGFILPALEPHERRVAMPLLSAVPFLFAGGVAFGYFVVLPAAVRFFANFNSADFNVLVQASPRSCSPWASSSRCPSWSSARPGWGSSLPASCAAAGPSPSPPAPPWPPSCPAMRSHCCSRRYRCICSTR
jgi:sec-independent protein translocase protein TatC